MAQPKNYGFGEEEQMLRDAARKFFQNNLPTDKLHKLVAGNPDPNRPAECLWDQSLWQQMVDLGWTMLAVPERAGGLGMSNVAVMCLVEEAGRAAFPSPLIPTLAATYLLSACETEAADEILAALVEGQAGAIALTNRQGSWESTDTDIVEEDGVLNGTAWFVQDAQKADFFVVSARNGNGVALYVVPKDATGLTIHADGIVDLTRDQAHLEFNAVAPQACVAAAGLGDVAIDKARPAILNIIAADMCGAAEWQLQTTVEYAQLRNQFDRPIGFFQAVKHPLVDLMLLIDQTRSLLYNAACAVDHEPEKAAQYAYMAKASACDMAAYGSSRSVQYHGGIGFTWECYVHLYFKRQKHNQMLFGDAVYQRAKLADILIGPMAA